MVSGHEFKRIRPRRGRTASTPPCEETLLARLAQQVVKRFARLGGALVALPLSVSGYEDGEDPAANPGHPACREHAGTDYCRESWLLHLAQLNADPETHWHRCDYDRLCALVPVIHQGRCLAAVKLACTPATPEAEFEHQVELLDLLVKDFVVPEADFLGRLPRRAAGVADLSVPAAGGNKAATQTPPSHPQILRAMEYVEEQLRDPALTVGTVARQMGVHPNYLSRLFVEQVGQRLSRFVAAQRVERAKTLLTTTNAQIKCIARDSGFANPNWFSYIFRALTGLTPGGYRRQVRAAARDD